MEINNGTELNYVSSMPTYIFAIQVLRLSTRKLHLIFLGMTAVSAQEKYNYFVLFS